MIFARVGILKFYEIVVRMMLMKSMVLVDVAVHSSIMHTMFGLQRVRSADLVLGFVVASDVEFVVVVVVGVEFVVAAAFGFVAAFDACAVTDVLATVVASVVGVVATVQSAGSESVVFGPAVVFDAAVVSEDGFDVVVAKSVAAAAVVVLTIVGAEQNVDWW